MQIFISYSRRDQPLAQRIHAALSAAGFGAFLDTKNLPPGQEYNARIKLAVDDADLFIFLASPDSVRSGSYALTELAFAKAKWPNPAGYVLPVLLENFNPGQLPAYLRPINGLQVHGNPEAEVVGWMQDRVNRGGLGIPGLLTPRERLERWARLAQPPLRRGRRIVHWRSCGSIVIGIVLLLFGLLFILFVNTTPFQSQGELFGTGMGILFALLGVGVVLYAIWTAFQGLRGGGTSVAAVVLDRKSTEHGITVTLETLNGRLTLQPATKATQEIYTGDMGWAYIRGSLLLEFIAKL